MNQFVLLMRLILCCFIFTSYFMSNTLAFSPPYHLEIASISTTGYGGTPLSIQPVIHVKDNNNNLVTGAGSSINVVASFYSGDNPFAQVKQSEMQTISLHSDDLLTSGTWSLSLNRNSITSTTSSLAYDASADDVKSAILALPNIGIVEVSKVTPTSYLTEWIIIFLSDSEDIPTFSVSWSGFSANYSLNPGNQMTVNVNVEGKTSQAIATFDGGIATFQNLGVNLSGKIKIKFIAVSLGLSVISTDIIISTVSLLIYH